MRAGSVAGGDRPEYPTLACGKPELAPGTLDFADDRRIRARGTAFLSGSSLEFRKFPVFRRVRLRVTFLRYFRLSTFRQRATG